MSDHHHHNHKGEAHPHQLEPPHEVFHDPQAGEIVRAWITRGNLSIAIHSMAFGKAEVWGHMLANLAMHVAHDCAEQGQGTIAGNLEDIRKAFAADMGKLAAKHSPLAAKG